MSKNISVLFIGVITYFLMAIYLINVPLQIIPFPEIIENVSEWIIFAGGIFLILGGINYFRANREKNVFV